MKSSFHLRGKIFGFLKHRGQRDIREELREMPKNKTSLSHLVATEHSRRNVTRVIKLVGEDQKQFDELMQIFLGTDKELARRAAWPIGFIAKDHPLLVKKWFPKLVANLDKPEQ